MAATVRAGMTERKSAPASTGPAGIAGVPPGGRLEFVVARNGLRLGRHVVAFRGGGGGALQVDIHAHFVVRRGADVAFRHGLAGQELWAGDELQSAEYRTDSNGERAHVTLRRESGGLRVEGPATASYLAAPGSLPATHWNRAEFAAPMINPQNGAILRYLASDRGEAATPGGGPPARRFRLAGASPLELWYDSAGLWAGLRARGADGSIVEYCRVAPKWEIGA